MRVRFSCLIALMLAITIAGPSSAKDPSGTASAGAILGAAQLAHASGAVIYRHICQACHMADAEGAIGAGHIPALAGDARLASAEYMMAIVLNGRGDMPAFGPRPDYTGLEAISHVTLSDAQIGAVINYVRTHFGNLYRDRITAADVHAVRLRTAAGAGAGGAAAGPRRDSTARR